MNYSSFPFKKILDWYKKNGRTGLPWREYDSFSIEHIGYYVWLAEVILQQTQVERGILYFRKIKEKYPTVAHLANTSYEDFFEDYK
jgi:A/G-specific adenine glycosylase